MKRFMLLSTLMSLLLACSPKQDTTSDVKMNSQDYSEIPEWAADATIYELNVRQYTEDGTFDALDSHIPRIAKMGIGIIWFMPIHPISMKKRKADGDTSIEDIVDPEERKKYLGSAYSIADYKKVNPDYGTDEDFRNLIDMIHANDMKAIIDWVPNHTGWDNPWITEHPEWYTTNDQGEIIDPIDYNTGEPWGWTDVADLNYDNQEMRKAMLDAMLYWVKEFDIDGFRVDVAHGIPQDFWDQMLDTIHSVKPLFMLAESEVPSHRNSGAYHADYGWSFHHLLNDISKGHKDISEIYAWKERHDRVYQKGISMHFTSNHDENSWAGTEFDRMGDAHKAMAVLVHTFEGIPLIYSGQEEPLRKRLEFFIKDTIPFGEYAYEDFYTTLLQLKKESKALQNGIYGGEVEFMFEDDQILAYSRKKDDDSVMVLINLSNEDASYTLDRDIAGSEIFTNETIQYKEGGELIMSPWSYMVLLPDEN